MSDPADSHSDSARVDPPEEKTSLCFRAPGGRMGIPRLKGLTELLRTADNPSITITRRQAIVVRASLGTIPEYIHKELASSKISVPNIKSYPFSSEADSPIVRKLDGDIDGMTDVPSLSYSPTNRYRSELKQDDICLLRNNRSLSVTYSLTTKTPKTLVDNVPLKFWSGLVDGIVRLISSTDADDTTTRSRSRMLTRAINESEGAEYPSGSDSWIDEDQLLEQAGENPPRFPASSPDGNDRSWLLVTIPGGHIAPGDLDTIIEITRSMSLNQLFLSPEQNILLRVPDDEESRVRSTLSEEIKDPLLGIPHRISTCPGSRFCVTAEYDSIQLARRLSTYLNEHPDLAVFNHAHPIAVASCGNTLNRERHHPLAIVPSHDESTLKLHMGGTPHEPSQLGLPVDDQVTYDEITDAIKQLVEAFMASDRDSLQQWAKDNRID